MITAQQLNKAYDRGPGDRRVLRDISLTLPDTGLVCILGSSGSGKTSLLNAIGGLDTFDSGTLSADHIQVSRYGTAAYEAHRNHNFGYIFQNYYLLPDHSVAYNVLLGLHSLPLSYPEKLERVQNALEAVEMAHYSRRKVSSLSGGQQQRIAIARALARRPRVIFADEPTGNLDEANTQNICTLLRRISRTSLVVMVTHEERIARFYADRIITLEGGVITSDSCSWERQALASQDSRVLYTGDYSDQTLRSQGLTLRLLRQEGAAPVEVTLLALTDRIVIKLADSRSVTCAEPDQPPVLQEGARPTLVLEELDQVPPDALPPQDPPGKAGIGLGFSMLLREALLLFRGGGLRTAGMGLFLVLLTLLSVLTLSDYLTLALLDPEDFITSDSHILELDVDQGSQLYDEGRNFSQVIASVIKDLRASGLDIRFVPHVSNTPEHSVTVFRQMASTTLKFSNFSYVPLEALEEDCLIYGRMPQNSREVVVDRWVLEKAAATDGILQNSIHDVSYFLGTTLHYSKRNYAPTIVGICDSGEPAVYIHPAGLISIGVSGVPVTPLSELQALYPGQYDQVSLQPGQCLVVVNNAGTTYYNRVGELYTTPSRQTLAIIQAIKADVPGSIVVDDSHLDDLLWSMYNRHFHLYCADKSAVRTYLAKKGTQAQKDGYAVVSVADHYTSTYRSYQAAASRKADARTVIITAVMLICLVMVYLLSRVRLQQRMGMLAVYRLLGIPAGKLAIIFALESGLATLTAVLPTVAVSYCYIQLARQIPELGSSLRLPAWAAGAVLVGIGCFCLLVSLLPMLRLLRLPPARLAAKYDL